MREMKASYRLLQRKVIVQGVHTTYSTIHYTGITGNGVRHQSKNTRVLLSLYPEQEGNKLMQWRTERGGGFRGSNPPLPEIPKALQNHAELEPIVKTAKNSRIYDAKTPRFSQKRQ